MGVAVKILAADVLARLKGIEERGGNLTGVFRDFGGYMKGSIDKNFAAGGRPDKWEPLKPQSLNAWGYSYKRGGSMRTKRGAPTKKGRAAIAGRLILVDKGLMRNSFFYIASPRSLVMASNDPKIKYHALGTKHLPVRNPLVFQDEDVAYIERSLLEFVMRG